MSIQDLGLVHQNVCLHFGVDTAAPRYPSFCYPESIEGFFTGKMFFTFLDSYGYDRSSEPSKVDTEKLYERGFP